MRTPVVVGILIVLVLLVGGYFALAHRSAPSTNTVQTAWVEVQSDSVSRDGTFGKNALRNGDSVGVGDIVETGPTGTAVIHFPDGSLARVDASTTLTLSEISFGTTDDSLIVSIGLSVGRVWSKVIGLATPQSSWEVQTSNTVATVRGTAFAVGYASGTSFVLGSQRTVAVAPISPKTKQKVATAEVTLEEGKLLQLTDADARDASTAIDSALLEAKITPITAAFRNDSWVRANQAADEQFDTMINALRTPGDTDASWRKKIREADAKYRALLIERQTTTTETKNPTTVATTTVITTPVVVPVTTPPAATLKVTADAPLDSVTVGDSIQFHALASSGTDTTESIHWRVIGPIGSVTTTGIFTAKLDASVAAATGYVAVVQQSGEVTPSEQVTVRAKTATFNPNSLP